MLTQENLVEVVDLLKRGQRCVEWNVYGGDAKVLVFLPGRNSFAFGLDDLDKVEAAVGVPLSVVPDVIPYALPLLVAAQHIPDHVWKNAVIKGMTILGRDDFRMEFAREHDLRSRMVGGQ